MMTDGLSIADAMALANGRDDNGMMGGWGSTWIWVFFLFFLLAWGGDGFGFGGRGNQATTAQVDMNSALTRAELYDGLNNTDIQRQIQGIQQGLSDLGYAQQAATLEGFNGVQAAIAQNGYMTQAAIAQAGYQAQLGQMGIGQQLMQNRFDTQLGLNGVTDAVTQNRFAAQMENCATNRNIDSVKYEASTHTADIVRAIQDEAAATRALINANEMQNLRDRLEERDRQLMTANFQISQVAQTNNLIDALNPTPKPAYITCSPYEATYYAQKGCGCGCNQGCGY